MKRGDLVRFTGSWEEGVPCEDVIGVILTWVRMGGPEGTVWEVLHPDGATMYWDENDLEVLSASR